VADSVTGSCHLIDLLMRLLLSFFQIFFHLLYHQFAWMYDLVAALVSLGRWKTWVGSALPYIEGRVLEIGFGPGHLQVSMHAAGLAAFGLDESRQMARQARRRLHRQGYSFNLSRGLAQHLPFSKAVFDTVVATFPSEYIFAPDTLAEIRRVLVPGGRLVILPSAWITGSSLLERLAAGLFTVTGQAGVLDAVIPSIQARLRASGFETRHELVETPGSRVLVFIAQSI
jgi:ubiquinone/menaquinone biosynthesis C-methylase UbiE